MKKDCSPSKLAAYKGLKYPTCGCAACYKRYAEIWAKKEPEEAANAVVDFYWIRLSQLVKESMKIVPKADQELLMMRLQEHSSVYGTGD